MAQIETWFAQDLLKPVSVQYISGNLFSQDNQGNKVGVRVTSGGEPVTLGGTISANVIRSDGGTVAVSGSSSGNEAWIVLPEAAYLVPGILSIIIKWTDSSVVTTLCACVTNVYQTTTDTVVDPGTVVSSIQDLIDAIDTAVASIPVDYSSLITTLAPAFSTGTAYTAGQYVSNDGAIYVFTTDHAAGSWDASQVTAANYGNDLTRLSSANNTQLEYVSHIENGTQWSYEQGAFNGYGEENSSNVQIRSYRYYNCNIDKINKITCDSGYVMTIRAWNDAGSYIGLLQTDGTISTGANVARVTTFDIYKYPQYNFRIALGKYSGSSFANISVTEATHIHYVYVDESCDNFKEKDETFNFGYKKYKAFSGTINSKNNTSISRRICRWEPGNTRGMTQLVVVQPGTCVVIHPGTSGNYVCMCSLLTSDDIDNVGHVWSSIPNTWSSNPVYINYFSTPCIIVGRFANTDTSTEFDPSAFDGYMLVSEKSWKNEMSLMGKKISVMGDSISSYSGYCPEGALTYYPHGDVDTWKKTFWGVLVSMYGMVIDTINAYAGTNVGTKWQDAERVSFIEESRLSDLGSPDYIIVEGGTNDFGGNPLGDYPEWNTYTNLYEFRTAYAYLLDQLKSRYPSARIICLTLMANNGYNTESGKYPEKQSAISQTLATDTTKHFLYEFNESIIELCKRYGCYVCDISDLMNYYNGSNEMYDSVHPHASTHRRIAYRLVEVLKTLV